MERSDYAGTIKLDLFANEIFLTTLSGDGLIISSSNGSTAYSFSAGYMIIYLLNLYYINLLKLLVRNILINNN